jgi:hypothetical protein
MILIKYLLVTVGIALFGSAAGLAGYDVWLALQLNRLLGRKKEAPGEPSLPFLSPAPSASPSPQPTRPIRWQLATRLAALGCVALLLSASIALVPDGYAGVRISQISGVRPGTLYPGAHLVTPLVERVVTYDVREKVYATAAGVPGAGNATAGGPATANGTEAAAKAPEGEVLTVQALRSRRSR